MFRHYTFRTSHYLPCYWLLQHGRHTTLMLWPFYYCHLSGCAYNRSVLDEISFFTPLVIKFPHPIKLFGYTESMLVRVYLYKPLIRHELVVVRPKLLLFFPLVEREHKKFISCCDAGKILLKQNVILL